MWPLLEIIHGRWPWTLARVSTPFVNVLACIVYRDFWWVAVHEPDGFCKLTGDLPDARSVIAMTLRCFVDRRKLPYADVNVVSSCHGTPSGGGCGWLAVAIEEFVRRNHEHGVSWYYRRLWEAGWTRVCGAGAYHRTRRMLNVIPISEPRW